MAPERDLSHSPGPAYPVYPAGPSRGVRPPLTRRLRPRHLIVIDCVTAALVSLVALSVVRSSAMVVSQNGIPVARVLVVQGELGGFAGALLLVAAGIFVPMALRRKAPALAFGAMLIVAALVASNAPQVAVVFFVAASYALFTVTVTSSRRSGVVALGLALAVMVIVSATRHPGLAVSNGNQVVLEAFANIVAWMLGYSVRQRRLYIVRLQEQAASSAVAEERLRIARELHDVVAHSMSVIAVQAGYGQYVIDTSPDGARDALGAIQATSRDALEEMRRMLGVLRQQDVAPPAGGAAAVSADAVSAGGGAAADPLADDADPLAGVAPGHVGDGQVPFAPAPGLANLDRLINRTCGAGVRVNLEIYGHARPLPAGIDLSAYRIIQEALTNVVKHAGSGARCTVHVGYDDGVLALRVTDDGGGVSTTLPRYGGPMTADAAPLADARVAADCDGRAVPDIPADIPAAAGQVPGVRGTADGWRAAGEPWPNTGHGIIGMRERANLCGGKFSAGPLPEGGFQVTASLPLSADAAAGRLVA